jgi:sugar phosphate isomerase/epimerase
MAMYQAPPASKGKYAFPLGIQMVLPDDYRRDSSFLKSMELLQEFNFSCVELNNADPLHLDPVILKAFLGQFGLSMTMFASGYAAKIHGLSLSDECLKDRLQTVQQCLKFIDFCSEMETGIILGLIQGPPVKDVAAARERFCLSLDELVPYAQKKNVRLVVEATNKGLTSIANTAAQTKDMVSAYPYSTVRILLDTYHMSLEENDMFDAITSHGGDFESIHYSDDNRFLPGLGRLNFKKITECLVSIGFIGPVVLEANIQHSFEIDLRASLNYLGPLLKQ